MQAMTDESRPMESRVLDVVFPDRANHYNTLFGGNALNLMSKAAFLAATRHARHHVVMAALDKVAFRKPVRVGDLVECVARISRVGRTSMTVIVELFSEDSLDGARCAAVRGAFEMVAVDADGRPTRILETRSGREIQKEAAS